MAGRWTDDRDWRDRELQRRMDERYDVFGLNDEGDRYAGREDRSFDRDERVFGERESGVSYNRPQRGFGRSESNRSGWQDQDYGGVSPAMRRGDYETGYRANPRFGSQDYTRGGQDRGGRFYGDDGRARLWSGDYEYGASYRPYDGEGRRFGSGEADRRWAREMRRGPDRTFSGGTGGYDYERGYGDGGREYERNRYEGGGEGFEDRARDAGDFLRRAGQRISNWFSDVAGEGSYDRGYAEDRKRYDEFRGARGRGPKGYQRSDDRISDEAHQRLTDDPWLDATEVNVSVSGGEVTLSGTVDSREAKHRAERIVEDVSGVKHVQNNLRVTAGSYFTTAGRGYGDSVQEARMASSDPVKDVTDGAATPPAQKRN
ncbi:BON domain-containing protein [Phenylobacterium sp.]|uniref:BON domain-containing protein n=1 Tax=Phenylobacterium sp. TaxID=1871053 RepID=UPI0025EB6B77|nr:BON domain-containing protein [Phenylobacterium sp.]